MITRRIIPAKGATVFLLAGVLLVFYPAGAGAVPTGYVNDSTVCLDCHDDMATAFERNVHQRLTDYQYRFVGSGRGCEACHGPGEAHAENAEAADIYLPSLDDGERASETCLACHRSDGTADWGMSVHAASDLSCQACHQMHGREAVPAYLAETEDELCFGCHLDTRAKFQLPSHHPVREGFMSCSDCHDPHGGEYAGIHLTEMSRELCLRCHAEHAGPFIFEHSPVEEDCAICHEVHGTVAQSLLRQNEPFLCLQCHQPHFHSGLQAIDGDFSPTPSVIDADEGYDGLSGTSTHDGMKRVMMTKCTQCHQAVHGTDLPSQSISGQGRAMNR